MTAYKLPKKIAARQHEITAEFMQELERHLQEIKTGQVTEMLEIRDFADRMHIHPTHLSNTLKQTTGQSPCDFFEAGIMRIARQMLEESPLSVAQIATHLTFDPSNFTKFFKRFAGVTPKQYRESVLLEKYEKN